MINYELKRSKRKSLTLTISKDLKVIVKAPINMPLEYIEKFVNKKYNWIEEHKELMRKRIEQKEIKALSKEEVELLKQKAKILLPQRIDYYSKIMNVKPTGVKITSANTRWGSCSSKNSLCFSYKVMLLPQDIIDYIVVHELAHIRVKNHSSKFYKEVYNYMPDYKDRVFRLRKIEKSM